MRSHHKGRAHARLHWDQEVEGSCYPSLIVPSKAVPGILSLVSSPSVQEDVGTLKRAREGPPRWSGALELTVYKQKLRVLS